MVLQFTAYLVLLSVSAALTAVLGYVLWRRSDGHLFSADGSLSVVQFAIFLWAVGQALVLGTVGLGLDLAGLYLSELGIALTAPAWVFFALTYTGNEDWLTRPRLAALLGVPAVGLTLALTNSPLGFHELYYANVAYTADGATASLSFVSGPARWFYAALMVGAHVVGATFVVRKFLASRNVYRKRTFLVLSVDVVAVLATLVAISPFDPVPYTTLVPSVYALFALVSLLALVSYRTLTLIPLRPILDAVGPRSKSLAPAARDRIIEEMDSGVLVLDHDNRLVDVNPIGRRMLGAADDRIIGKALTDIIDPNVYASGDVSVLDPAVTTGQFSGVWVSLDGEERCFDISVTPLTDDDEVTGRALLIHDVTARERRKQRLKARTTELERQNERLDDFAAIVSHDLRNPLNVANCAVDLAEEHGDPEYYDKLRWSHDRIETIIDDVLTLARQGQTIEETEPVTLDAAATDAWRHVETDEASLSVVADTTVEADKGRLVQVFENLFRNAVEHSNGDVTVTVGPLEEGLYIADDGPGIPEDKYDDVLERGFTTSDTGTGLGLSIVRTVVDAHSWDITVTSSTEGGARFEITGATAPDTPTLTHGTA
ncbi:histidine kinase N-terminal 7TM domain-containing protein [Halorientalis litorea]|uniref:histidine kinase N-terminal 7TM domain-containing protein n=1 Tax=Halorientalis litorea TaxID=2931977 RepID=UPI001FF66C7A|nr:histidine kinase N-terminal 7TM domain-containing protein [Halorientalis litorea]